MNRRFRARFRFERHVSGLSHADIRAAPSFSIFHVNGVRRNVGLLLFFNRIVQDNVLYLIYLS